MTHTTWFALQIHTIPYPSRLIPVRCLIGTFAGQLVLCNFLNWAVRTAPGHCVDNSLNAASPTQTHTEPNSRKLQPDTRFKLLLRFPPCAKNSRFRATSTQTGYLFLLTAPTLNIKPQVPPWVSCRATTYVIELLVPWHPGLRQSTRRQAPRLRFFFFSSWIQTHLAVIFIFTSFLF